MPDSKYQAWLSIHHPTADTVGNHPAPSPITVGLHGSPHVTPVHVNSPTTYCSLAGHEMFTQSITPVRQEFQSNPTQLKLNNLTHKPTTPTF